MKRIDFNEVEKLVTYGNMTVVLSKWKNGFWCDSYDIDPACLRPYEFAGETYLLAPKEVPDDIMLAMLDEAAGKRVFAGARIRGVITTEYDGNTYYLALID